MGKGISVILNKLAGKDSERLALAGWFITITMVQKARVT